jgi:cytidylate kinase
MRCIVLYGPPAVGKLTVAHELAKKGSSHIFDPHKVIELIAPVVGGNDAELINLSYSLQLQILNAAMRFSPNDIIMPFTFTADLQPDIAFLQTVLEAGSAHNVQVDLIHLTAKHRVLLERAAQESRKGTTKITDPILLENLLKTYNFDKPMPGDNAVTINTTHLTAGEVAQQILRTTKAD